MGRETKVGLTVGLAFVVLFGVILSSRASTEAPEHAVLRVGDAARHRTMEQSIRRSVDPFMEKTVLDLLADGVAPPDDAGKEEAMPAPKRVEAVETPAVPGAQKGTIATGPAVIETPMTRGREATVEAGVDDTPERASPRPSAGPARRTHRVRRGDTLVAIARRFYGSDDERLWKGIFEANKSALRSPDRLLVGQELVIPGLPAALQAEPQAAVVRDDAPSVTADELAEMLGGQTDLQESPASRPATYKVKPGDSFYGIAERLYGDARLGRLLHLRNRHLVPDAKLLRVGQTILLLDGVQQPSDGVTVAMR